MKLKTPRDWYRRDRVGRRPGLLFLFELLAAGVWTRVAARRIARARPVDPGIPVICVGNLTVGGAGKTPIVRELTKALIARGVAAHVLTRGHGGSLAGPVRVDPAIHSAAEVGDEALMLAGVLQADGAPVWVARDRVAGARAAAAAGAAVIVMDDGHQNPSLHKTLSLVVVDGETRDGEWPFGDGRVVPAGPMREPIAAGLARADAVIVLLPADLPTVDPELLALFAGKPVQIARLVPLAAPPPGPQVGFAGIGKPWKLERALRAAGCDLVDFAPLADHEVPSERFLAFLARRAETLGAGLVTTEKDWARLSPAWREWVKFWPVAVRFEDDAALAALLTPVLPGKL
jgi:tetraacyldisaccharide 4'-kinase